ncbi:MAG: FtsQ-type POTRA domain-containing protein [Anaerolineae bacterium]|nr:FtsQ-type POTRA domain-containing protein [Anaerolineae bacterium]MCB0199020.1 FtsQ-type POTRA domain-containing protein [Anaerolineae bacterium]MCB0205953.1 FtsQ-type POTRA domain-containing protein [Anaerolineae bacterium]MCB0253014.1 FtsQ-type POTRA domain-containing protein [Anaerolineae bacterium]
MIGKSKSRPAKSRKRTPEERRRSARKQSRSYRSTAPAPVKVQRRTKTAKPAKPRKPRKPLAMPRVDKGRALAVILAVALAALVVFGFADSRFYVQTADIRGLAHSPADEVYRQADVDGYSIFWVNARAAAQRIEALPYVKRATVQTSLPNRVLIDIEERVPVAVWRVNGQELWVDVDGVTMPIASQDIQLPVFTDLDGSSVQPDGSVDPLLISSVHELKQRLPEINEFAYDRFNGLQFHLASGTAVLLGSPDGLAQRVEELLVLQGSLASLGQMPLEIDWRFEDGYTLKLP